MGGQGSRTSTATTRIRDRTAKSADATQTLCVWLTGFTGVALAIAFLRISYFPRTLAVVLWAAALLALEVGTGMLTGSRTQVAGAILTLLAVLTLSGQFRFSVRHALFVPVVVALFGFTHVYRTLPYAAARDLGGVMDRAGDGG